MSFLLIFFFNLIILTSANSTKSYKPIYHLFNKTLILDCSSGKEWYMKNKSSGMEYPIKDSKKYQIENNGEGSKLTVSEPEDDTYFSVKDAECNSVIKLFALAEHFRAYLTFNDNLTFNTSLSHRSPINYRINLTSVDSEKITINFRYRVEGTRLKSLYFNKNPLSHRLCTPHINITYYNCFEANQTETLNSSTKKVKWNFTYATEKIEAEEELVVNGVISVDINLSFPPKLAINVKKIELRRNEDAILNCSVENVNSDVEHYNWISNSSSYIINPTIYNSPIYNYKYNHEIDDVHIICNASNKAAYSLVHFYITNHKSALNKYSKTDPTMVMLTIVIAVIIIAIIMGVIIFVLKLKIRNQCKNKGKQTQQHENQKTIEERELKIDKSKNNDDLKKEARPLKKQASKKRNNKVEKDKKATEF